jgi:hypothetical protein
LCFSGGVPILVLSVVVPILLLAVPSPPNESSRELSVLEESVLAEFLVWSPLGEEVQELNNITAHSVVIEIFSAFVMTGYLTVYL